jgi:hypothetical protein
MAQKRKSIGGWLASPKGIAVVRASAERSRREADRLREALAVTQEQMDRPMTI